MLLIINFIWQLFYFLFLDLFSYVFLFRAGFRGRNHYNYYINEYGLLKSDYNKKTKNKQWFNGKYRALFSVFSEYYEEFE